MNRRHFIRNSLMAAVLLPLGNFLGLSSAWAKDDKKACAAVDVNSALAKALKYAPDASKSKDRKDKTQTCANCFHFQADKGGADEGGCPFFANACVGKKAWCGSWAPKKS